MWVNTGPDLDKCQQSAWFRATQRPQLCSYSRFLFWSAPYFSPNKHLSSFFQQFVPSHLGMRPLHITLPSSKWQVMVSAPWVLMKPSSQTTDMELPSWKLSPKRRAFKGMPGSGHSLRPKACDKKKQETRSSDDLCAMKNGIFEEQVCKKENGCVQRGRNRKTKQGRCVHENDSWTLWCRRHDEENYCRGIAWGLRNCAYCFVKALKLYTQWSQLAWAKNENKGDQSAQGKWVQGLKLKTRADKPHPTHQKPHCAVNVLLIKTFHLKKIYDQCMKPVLTAVGDVESSARHWVISLKLELQHVAVGREVRGNLSARESAHQRAPWLVSILDGEEIVWRLQIKIVECQMNPGAGLGDDQPNTVEVVSIALWVVGRQHSPHRCREVGETGDWRDKEEKKWKYLSKNCNSEGVCFVATQRLIMWLCTLWIPAIIGSDKKSAGQKQTVSSG